MPVAEAVSPIPGVPTTQTLLEGAHPRKGLNQWLATGICGNDITSSVLYVSGIAAVYAGVLAPVVLLAVIVVLVVPKNNIFIGAPEQKHSFSVQDLGGVRVIF